MDYKEDKCLILKDDDGQIVFLSENQITVTGKYGDIVISGNSIYYTSNAPTYDELYEHWLKTKDKPKRKRKSDQLPGQTDMFDIIDNQ